MAGLRGLTAIFKVGREFRTEPKFNLKRFVPPLSDYTSASKQRPRDFLKVAINRGRELSRPARGVTSWGNAATVNGPARWPRP